MRCLSRALSFILLLAGAAQGQEGLPTDIQVGERLPPLSGVDLDGEPVSLSGYLGDETLVLSFWSVHCADCVRELDDLQSIRRDFPSENLTVVAVNTDAHPFMEALLERFAAEVLSGPLSPPNAGSSKVSLDRYAGTYRLARHAHRGVDKLAVLAGLPMPDLHVEVQADSALVVAAGEACERLYPAGPPGAYIRPGLDPRRYYFETGAGGSAVRIHTD